LGAVNAHRPYLIVFAVLVAAFVALYPYLGAIGACDHGECPYMVQSSHTTASSLLSTCLSAVLSASPAGVLALALLHRRRINATQSRPEEIFLPPDPPPPQLS
jgi:hypothetical protein